MLVLLSPKGLMQRPASAQNPCKHLHRPFTQVAGPREESHPRNLHVPPVSWQQDGPKDASSPCGTHWPSRAQKSGSHRHLPCKHAVDPREEEQPKMRHVPPVSAWQGRPDEGSSWRSGT
mmetsp:Transcript_39303/g.108402  ORF Transcript_39303/g.108402 Transcript_39303/m.108402 type:complete len:119 (-) Transcript_39303:1705-2061(-)